MEAFIDRFLLRKTPAQMAGKKASRAWMKILDHTDEAVETLTGLSLYNHAQAEARKWLVSTYSRSKHGFWSIDDERHPDRKRHEEFLEYVEAFISEFPPESRGYPKE